MSRVAVITGGVGYLGRAVCCAFCRSGWKVVTSYRRESEFQALLQMAGEGAAISGVEADVGDWAQADSLIAHAALDGEIKALINIAGGFAMSPFAQTSETDWDQMHRTNLQTAAATSHSAIPYLISAGGGAIVNIGSRAALEPQAKTSAYACAKAAVHALTQTLAIELKGHNIRVNCVVPSTIDTPANRRAMPDADHSAWVQPERLAEVIRFLCEDQARDITGGLIPVYGRL